MFQLEISPNPENQYSGHLHDCKLAAEHGAPRNTAHSVITLSYRGFWD